MAPSVQASLASSTLGSLHRQLGRHAEGRAHDVRAYQQAIEAIQDASAASVVAANLDDGGDRDDGAVAAQPGAEGVLEAVIEAVVEACLGLAADSVGLGDVAQAKDWLAQAQDRLVAAGPSAGWRVRTRAAWVSAEVALLQGDSDGAAGPAAEAVQLAERAGAPRHVAKGLLFCAVAELGRPGRREQARMALLRAWVSARELGALPLVWPAGGLLNETFGEILDPAQRVDVLSATRAAIETICAGLPGPMAADWTAGSDLRWILDPR